MLMDKEVTQNRITTCANLLAQHSYVHYFSILLTLAACVIMLLMALMGSLTLISFLLMLGIIITGFIEMIFAIRVGFDEKLLRQVGTPNVAEELVLKKLDDGLLFNKLVPADKADRNLQQRLTGCVGLFKRQSTVCAIQLVMVISAAFVLWINS